MVDRCNTIVQSVVRVFIQFIYVQIVANLLNAMIVLDGCIWNGIEENRRVKKENRFRCLNANERNWIEFRLNIVCNWKLKIDVIYWPLCVQMYSIPDRWMSGHFNVTASPSMGLIMVVDSFWSMWESPLLTARGRKKKKKKNEDTCHLNVELFIVSLSSVVCQSYPSFILIRFERKGNAVDRIINWSMKVRHRHYISFSPIDSCLQFQLFAFGNDCILQLILPHHQQIASFVQIHCEYTSLHWQTPKHLLHCELWNKANDVGCCIAPLMRAQQTNNDIALALDIRRRRRNLNRSCGEKTQFFIFFFFLFPFYISSAACHLLVKGLGRQWRRTMEFDGIVVSAAALKRESMHIDIRTSAANQFDRASAFIHPFSFKWFNSSFCQCPLHFSTFFFRSSTLWYTGYAVIRLNATFAHSFRESTNSIEFYVFAFSHVYFVSFWRFLSFSRCFLLDVWSDSTSRLITDESGRYRIYSGARCTLHSQWFISREENNWKTSERNLVSNKEMQLWPFLLPNSANENDSNKFGFSISS